MERNALGRGLSALIPAGNKLQEKIQYIEVDRINTSNFQPRTYFSDIKLQELIESIKEKGVIQPILLRPFGNGFQIIAGERRYRAAKMQGLKEIPAIVREVKDGDALELALIENIQREELTKIEEAKAFKRLSEEFGMTHEDISKKVSKDRATVTNTLRLLDLPGKIQSFLEENTITMGHARALLSLEDIKAQEKTCDKIIKHHLSVRQSETLVRNQLLHDPQKRKAKKKDIHLAAVEDKLQHYLGTRTKIFQGKKRGKIVIDYYSHEDLNRLLALIIPSN